MPYLVFVFFIKFCFSTEDQSSALSLSVKSVFHDSEAQVRKIEEGVLAVRNINVDKLDLFSVRQSSRQFIDQAFSDINNSLHIVNKSNALLLNDFNQSSFGTIKDLNTLKSWFSANNINFSEDSLEKITKDFHKNVSKGKINLQAPYSGKVFYKKEVKYNGNAYYSGSVDYSGTEYYYGNKKCENSNYCGNKVACSGTVSCSNHAFACDGHYYSDYNFCQKNVSCTNTVYYNGNVSYSGSKNYNGYTKYSGTCQADGWQNYQGNTSTTCNNDHHNCSCNSVANLALSLKSVIREKDHLKSQNDILLQKVNYLNNAFSNLEGVIGSLKKFSTENDKVINQLDLERSELRNKESLSQEAVNAFLIFSKSYGNQQKMVLTMISEKQEEEKNNIREIIKSYEEKIKDQSEQIDKNKEKLNDAHNDLQKIIFEHRDTEIKTTKKILNDKEKFNEQEKAYLESISKLQQDYNQLLTLNKIRESLVRGLISRFSKKITKILKGEEPDFLKEIKTSPFDDLLDNAQDYLNEL
jgi:hypothetical protein